MASVPLPSQKLSSEPSAPSPQGVAVPVRFTGMPLVAVCGGLLAVAGVLTVWPTALLLWSLWVTDPLKSIGAFIPAVSFLLILRVWRALAWEADGSWWGIVLLVVTAAVVAVRDRAVLELVLGPGWSITLPPHSVVAVAYACSLVLLVGGWAFLRAAWFPVLLMWFVNPVPHAFNLWIDLPLQHASAEVARGLAHALGQRLTPDQLYLMFTPDFGMFIAPGCDGIRGSITMGLIALVAGYLYRFRLRVWAATVAGALLLGYLFNLLRLCVLVLYYVGALHLQWLQSHAEMADYVIGASLFFFATMLLFAVIRRCSSDGTLRIPPLRVKPGTPAVARPASGIWILYSVLAVIVVLSAVPSLRGASRIPPSLVAGSDGVYFPEQVGRYHLQRRWTEKLETGQPIFEWGTYAIPGSSGGVELGISPVLGAHDTLLCHAARGEDWLWHGSLDFHTLTGSVSFSGSFFNDTAEASLEATTVCTAGSCGQWTSERKHFGLVYSRPAAQAWGGQASRPVPVMLRAVQADRPAAGSDARPTLVAELQDFLASAPFGTFTYRYPRP